MLRKINDMLSNSSQKEDANARDDNSANPHGEVIPSGKQTFFVSGHCSSSFFSSSLQ
jgi:hypothetical protein